MDPIALGVCGLGRIGVDHCRWFSRNREQYRLTALCDVDPQRLNHLALEYGAREYNDLDALTADPEVELVIVATRSLDHVRHARRALEARKIVLLEKPIAVTEKDFRDLTQLEAAYPGKLYFGHNHRFEPAFTQMRAMIDSGALGRVYGIKLSRHRPFERRNDWQTRLDCGGGQLSVWGPHLIDQGLQLLGAPVRDVWSRLQRILTPGDGDDHVNIVLTGENGVVVEVEISNCVALPCPYAVVYGDRGILKCDQEQKHIHIKHLDPQFRWPDAVAHAETPAPGHGFNDDPELPWIEKTVKVEPEGNMWEIVEIELAKRLYDAIRRGVPFPVKNAEALEVVRITEMVKRRNPQFAWLQ